MIYTLEGRRLETADEDHFIAPGAQVIGSVRLGRRASVWFGCVLRADDDWIIVGDGTNVQDLSVIHADPKFPTEIGRNVSIGHRALLHSCYIGEGSLIANGAIVLDRVRIGRDCLIAAGALVPPGKEIADGSVIMGVPGRLVRQVSEHDLAMMRQIAAHYQRRQEEYRCGLRIDPRSSREMPADAGTQALSLTIRG